jgi:hypothetical protein
MHFSFSHRDLQLRHKLIRSNALDNLRRIGVGNAGSPKLIVSIERSRDPTTGDRHFEASVAVETSLQIAFKT